MENQGLSSLRYSNGSLSLTGPWITELYCHVEARRGIAPEASSGFRVFTVSQGVTKAATTGSANAIFLVMENLAIVYESLDLGMMVRLHSARRD